MENITKQDLYGMLEVEHTASQQEIKKAYRKKALKCHPDKNPDNPRAVKLFQELSKALEILTDEAAKAAYDAVLRAKRVREVRNRELDAKRKKFKEDLEAREAAAAKEQVINVDVAKNLEKEIERLRKEGSKELEKEREYLKQQIEKELKEASKPDPWKPILKLSWKADKNDKTNGGYSQDSLTKCLSPYGTILFLVVSAKKKGSAVIEFSDIKSALNAVQKEKGIPENPLNFTWVHGEPKITVTEPKESKANLSDDLYNDYESYVLMNLNRAAQKQQEINKINNE